MALRKKQLSEIEILQAQRADLAERMAEADKIAKQADPVAEWAKVSKAASDYLALERAIYTLDQRIAEAEALAREQAAQERDAAKQERAIAAKVRAEALAEQLAGEMVRLDQGLLADLDGALAELASAGGWPAPMVGTAAHLRRQIGASLAGWRSISPRWFGLPEPRPAAELALEERQLAVKRAEERLADARKQAKAAMSSSSWQRVLDNHAHGLAAARRQLLALTSPDLSEDELFTRATAGLHDELGTYIGDHWEWRREQIRKEEREAREAALLAA